MLKKLSLSVLRLRDYRLLLFTRMFVTMALQAQAVIVGWQIYSITKSPFILGLTGLAEALPAITCAFFAGHFVDIGYPRKIYTAFIAILALNTFALLAVGGGMIAVSDDHLLIYLFVGVFISGVARSFLMPAAFSLLSRIVTRQEMASAVAWNSSGIQTAAIAGPAVAGLIYGGYGAHAAWMLPALLMLMAVMMVSTLRTPHVRNGEKREPTMQSIRAGWKFIIQTPVLFSVMALDMFAVLFGGAVAMLPAYADQVLHVGSEGLGALRAAPAIGSVFMGLIMALWPMKRITAMQMFYTVAGFGLCMIGFGMSTVFWVSFAFLTASGAFDNISVLIRSTLAQLLTPDHMRGRVSAISSMFIISSNEIGAFESGVAARAMGLVPSVIFGGIMTLVVVVSTALISPKLRKTVVDTEKN